MHSNGVIHRDIKPENLVFDSNGYLHITDLGISRIWTAENSKETSGTPGYMAPEVMCRQNHGVACDYFAVGIIVYEIMLKSRPYKGKTRKEIRDQILSKQVQITQEEIPNDWSIEAADFINKVIHIQLIKRKPVNRLGLNGPEEVKNHPWLSDVKWEKIREKNFASPYKPNALQDNFDNRVLLTDDPLLEADAKAKDIKQDDKTTNDLFAEYFYNIHDENSSTNKHK